MHRPSAPFSGPCDVAGPILTNSFEVRATSIFAYSRKTLGVAGGSGAASGEGPGGPQRARASIFGLGERTLSRLRAVLHGAESFG
eukprot:14221368-Alexandrium_andersonii.AAC.1